MNEHEWRSGSGDWIADERGLRRGSVEIAQGCNGREIAAEILRLSARVKELESGERRRQIQLLEDISGAGNSLYDAQDTLDEKGRLIQAKLAELRAEGKL